MSKLRKPGKMDDEKQPLKNEVRYYEEIKTTAGVPYDRSEGDVMATGGPANLISKIKAEGDKAADEKKSSSSSNDKEKSNRVILNHDQLCAFREIIEHIYEDMEIPTVRKILIAARKNFNFEGSRAKIRGILRHRLGFKFNSRYQDNNLVLERNTIKYLRITYLRDLRKNDDIGKNERPVVYVGETLIKCPNKSLVNGSESKKRGQKWMIFHAGTENGFLSDEFLYSFTSNKEKPKDTDFLKYIENFVIPKLPKNSIIITNHTQEHNLEVDAIPTIFSPKEYVKKWMVNHNIPFEEHMLKRELITLIKATRPEKKYALDELLAKHGHGVLRTPPYHSDLNPLDYILMKIKSLVLIQSKGGVDINSDLISKVIKSITAEDWKEQIKRVKKIEERYWVRDVEKEDDYEDILDRIGRLSDTDTDSSSEASYWSSSSSEVDDEGSAGDWTDIDENSDDSVNFTSV